MADGVFARALQLIGNLVLLRLIAPNEYGEVITAAICVGTAGQLTSFAFGQYLISMRAPANVAFQAATLHVAVGAVSMVVVIGLGGVLGRWFDMPEMGRFIIGYAIAHLVDRVRYVPDRLLVRALKFRTVASCNGAGEIIFTVTTLALVSSLGGWAIVVGQVVRSVSIATLILIASPRAEWWAPQWPEAGAVRGLFGYGWPIMVGSLADRAASMWDNLIITKMF